MRHIIWFNQEDNKFSFGPEEEYKTLKEQKGKSIQLQKSFYQVSAELVKKVTVVMNRRSMSIQTS